MSRKKNDVILKLEKLPCPLSANELEVKRETLVLHLNEKARIQAEAKQEADKYKVQVAAIDEEIRTTLKAVTEKQEIRSVECELRFDVSRNTVELIRRDSFQVVGNPRAITAEERERLQLPSPAGANDASFPGANGKASKKSKAKSVGAEA